MFPAEPRRAQPSPSKWIAAALVLCALSACSTIWPFNIKSKRESERHAEQIQVLNYKVMRFADQYVGGILEPIRDFQRSTTNPEEQLQAQNWKLSQATAAYTIASGPNPTTNSLDMVVLATLSRMVVEDVWVHGKVGARAQPLLDAQMRLEARATELVQGVLDPTQFEQLQSVIVQWREQNPQVRDVSYVHFLDLAKSIGPQAEGATHTGLFNMLGLDPFSTLDPAVREIAQSRALAERTVYYAERLPGLLDMQVERLSYQFAVTPETKRVLNDADRAAAAAETAARVAGELPEVLTRERQAAIQQFMDAITVETARTRQLVIDLRQTLEAGTATSNSLNTTIHSFDELVARLNPPKKPGAPEPAPGHPFDIREYTQAATALSQTSEQLQLLIAGIEKGTPALGSAATQAAASLQGVVDHAFWRLVQLIALLCTGSLAAALAYRAIRRRWLS